MSVEPKAEQPAASSGEQPAPAIQSTPVPISQRLEEYKMKSKSAFILGSTGLVGKELLRVMVDSKAFSKILLLSRRELTLEDDIKAAVDVKIVDFNDLEASRDVFNGVNVGFCCLGTTRAKAGSAEAFYKVDHDYVVDAAKIAADVGCEHFHLVSSKGASAGSSNLYLKTKGEAERDVSALSFKRVSIYRPGFLLGEREDARMGEKIFGAIMKPVIYLSPTSISTPATTVAKAMLNCTILPSNSDRDMFDISAMFGMADEKPGCK